MKNVIPSALDVFVSCAMLLMVTAVRADVAKPVAIYAMYQISAGGPWSQNYTADTETPGVIMGPGTTTSVSTASSVDVSGDPDTLPQSVYCHARVGRVVLYEFIGLKPGGLYNVRLHFCSMERAKPRFDVLVSDNVSVGASRLRTILHHFSPPVGRADFQTAQTHAGSNGNLVVIGTSKVSGDHGNAQFNGIEIVPTALPDKLPASVLNVRKFGARGDGVTDDRSAIQRTIDAAIAKGPGAVVLVPAGTYCLSNRIMIENATKLSIRGQGNPVLLATDIHNNLLQFNNCSNLVLGGITLQFPLGYTQGTIRAVDVGAKTVDVGIESGYPNLDNALFSKPSHDRVHPFTYPSAHTYEQDADEPDTQSLTQTGQRTWHLTLYKPPHADWAGKRFLIDDFANGTALSGDNNTDVTVEDVKVHGGGTCTPYYFVHTHGTFTFRRFTISARPGTDDLAGSNGGGQFASVTGTLVFEDCDFSKGDDDGFDGHTDGYQRVLRQIDPATLLLQIHTDYQPGDEIALIDWKTMSERTREHVVSAVNNADGTCTLTLDKPVTVGQTGPGNGEPWGTEPMKDGIDRVIDVSDVGQATVFRHDRMSALRARPINTKMRNCLIEDCYFYDCEIYAIEAGPEFYWEEGPAIRGLIIRHNQFTNCDEANVAVGMFNAPDGCVSTDNEDIVIKDNKFSNYGAHINAYSNPIGAVLVTNSKNVDIEGNDFGESAKPAAPGCAKLTVTKCANVTIKSNKGIPASQQTTSLASTGRN